MSDLIIKLSKLTPNQIHNHLVKHLPLAMHDSIKHEVEDYKQQRKAEKLKTYHLRDQWGELLRHLTYELANTRVGARYNSRNPKPERDAAFAAYIKVMERLHALIKDNYSQSGTTPSVMAKEKNVPNNGEHWTDWVPEHVKDKVRFLFDGVPYVPKTKRKLPFQRTARPKRHASSKTKREVLIETVHREMEHVVRAQSVADTEALRYKQQRLRRALDWLEQANERTAMPRTWHGVLRQIENGSD